MLSRKGTVEPGLKTLLWARDNAAQGWKLKSGGRQEVK